MGPRAEKVNRQRDALETVGLADDGLVAVDKLLVLLCERLDDALESDNLLPRCRGVLERARRAAPSARRVARGRGRRCEFLQAFDLPLGVAQILAKLADEDIVLRRFALRALEVGLGPGELLVHALEVIGESSRRIA